MLRMIAWVFGLSLRAMNNSRKGIWWKCFQLLFVHPSSSHSWCHAQCENWSCQGSLAPPLDPWNDKVTILSMTNFKSGETTITEFFNGVGVVLPQIVTSYIFCVGYIIVYHLVHHSNAAFRWVELWAKWSGEWYHNQILTDGAALRSRSGMCLVGPTSGKLCHMHSKGSKVVLMTKNLHLVALVTLCMTNFWMVVPPEWKLVMVKDSRHHST